ncbi:MAG: hypothetical protein ONB23_11940 [candidate division KSB1 bacterium]|nr:hypothetical protein [candidate division KSB1 bacterium]
MKRFAWHGWVGLSVLLISEVLMFKRVWFFSVYFTPLAWTAYILILDAWLEGRRGTSWIARYPGRFLSMLAYSIAVWLVFEAYNLVIRNWRYVGLPENLALRLVGYGWAFATIFPGILLTSELLDSYGLFDRVHVPPARISERTLVAWFLVGAVCAVGPLLAPQSIAPYLIAPVWVGFIFLVDPVLGLAQGESLLIRLRGGDVRKLTSLFVSGLICGFLWEFWNYWAQTKWVYTFPYLQKPKIFEMPLAGFLGFPPFALEVYAFWNLLAFLTGWKQKGSSLYDELNA